MPLVGTTSSVLEKIEDPSAVVYELVSDGGEGAIPNVANPLLPTNTDVSR